MRWLSEFADERNLTSPDSEQIEYIVAKQLVRNSVSVEQIQDRAECFCGCTIKYISKTRRPVKRHRTRQSPNLHHLKQLEQLKSKPKGSFLMLSIHLSFEEIIADLNSANPTSAISFLASFTRFSIVANGSLKTTLTFKYFFLSYLSYNDSSCYEKAENRTK